MIYKTTDQGLAELLQVLLGKTGIEYDVVRSFGSLHWDEDINPSRPIDIITTITIKKNKKNKMSDWEITNNHHYNVELAKEEFERGGEIYNYAENLLSAVDYFKDKSSRLEKELQTVNKENNNE